MLTVVLDTNVLIAACEDYLSPSGQILDLVREGKVRAAVNRRILGEYEAIIADRAKKGERERLEDVFDAFEDVGVSWGERVVEDDPDDDKFVHCARDARADYVISKDSHLLFMREVGGIAIVTPEDFLSHYQNHSDPEGREEWDSWAKMILGK